MSQIRNSNNSDQIPRISRDFQEQFDAKLTQQHSFSRERENPLSEERISFSQSIIHPQSFILPESQSRRLSRGDAQQAMRSQSPINIYQSSHHHSYLIPPSPSQFTIFPATTSVTSSSNVGANFQRSNPLQLHYTSVNSSGSQLTTSGSFNLSQGSFFIGTGPNTPLRQNSHPHNNSITVYTAQNNNNSIDASRGHSPNRSGNQSYSIQGSFEKVASKGLISKSPGLSSGSERNPANENKEIKRDEGSMEVVGFQQCNTEYSNNDSLNVNNSSNVKINVQQFLQQSSQQIPQNLSAPNSNSKNNTFLLSKTSNSNEQMFNQRVSTINDDADLDQLSIPNSTQSYDERRNSMETYKYKGEQSGISIADFGTKNKDQKGSFFNQQTHVGQTVKIDLNSQISAQNTTNNNAKLPIVQKPTHQSLEPQDSKSASAVNNTSEPLKPEPTKDSRNSEVESLQKYIFALQSQLDLSNQRNSELSFLLKNIEHSQKEFEIVKNDSVFLTRQIAIKSNENNTLQKEVQFQDQQIQELQTQNQAYAERCQQQEKDIILLKLENQNLQFDETSSPKNLSTMDSSQQKLKSSDQNTAELISHNNLSPQQSNEIKNNNHIYKQLPIINEESKQHSEDYNQKTGIENNHSFMEFSSIKKSSNNNHDNTSNEITLNLGGNQDRYNAIEFESKLSQLAHQNNELNQKNQQLSEENNKIKFTYQQLQIEKIILERQITQYKMESQIMIQLKENEIDTQRELESLYSIIEKKEQSLLEKQDKISGLNVQQENLAKELDEVKFQVQLKVSEITGLRATNEKLNEENFQLRKKDLDSVPQTPESSESNQIFLSHYTQMAGALDKTSKENEQLKEQVSYLNSQVQEFQRSKTQTDRTSEELKKVSELERVIRDLKQKNKDSQSKISSLSFALQVHQDQSQKSIQEAEQVRRQLQSLQIQYNLNQNQLEEQQKLYASIKADYSIKEDAPQVNSFGLRHPDSYTNQISHHSKTNLSGDFQNSTIKDKQFSEPMYDQLNLSCSFSEIDQSINQSTYSNNNQYPHFNNLNAIDLNNNNQNHNRSTNNYYSNNESQSPNKLYGSILNTSVNQNQIDILINKHLENELKLSSDENNIKQQIDFSPNIQQIYPRTNISPSPSQQEFM